MVAIDTTTTGDDKMSVNNNNNNAAAASMPIVVPNPQEDPQSSSAEVVPMDEGATASSSSPSPPSANNISLRVREATPADEEEDEESVKGRNRQHDEDDADADDESSYPPSSRHSLSQEGGSLLLPRHSSSLSSSSMRLPFPHHVPRRERSHSTVISAFPSASSPTGSSSNLHHLLDPSSDLSEPSNKLKRRTKSTCGPISVSPPGKSARSERLAVPSGLDASETISNKPPIVGGGVRLRESRYHGHHHHPHGGSVGRHHHYHLSPHVRFSNIEGKLPQVELLGSDGNTVLVSASSAAAVAAAAMPPSSSGGKRAGRCHHMIVEEAGGGGANGGGGGTSGNGSPHVVQRTQSNPEMEYCPVCLARKECEILLKRTYSKVVKKSQNVAWYAYLVLKSRENCFERETTS